MDTITQGLLGAVTSQLGFRQRIGRDATWVATFAAIVPDLDIFVAPLLSLTGVEFGRNAHILGHRGLSHSLLAVPVIALPITLIWWWARRALRKREGPHVQHKTTARPPPHFGLLYLCILVAVLSHPLLDWCTSYGTCLLAPITDTRYASDCIGIIDIIYTPILLLTLAACFIVRKLTRSPAARATLIVGWAGFVLSVGYLGAGRCLHDRTVARARQLNAGAEILRIDAYPAIGTIFLWRAVVETPDLWIAHRIRPLGGAVRTGSAPKVHNRWVDRARELPQVKTFEWFAMGRTRAKYERRNGLHVVELSDMRYGRSAESPQGIWGVRATFEPSGRLRNVERIREVRSGNFRTHIKRAWNEIWTP